MAERELTTTCTVDTQMLYMVDEYRRHVASVLLHALRNELELPSSAVNELTSALDFLPTASAPMRMRMLQLRSFTGDAVMLAVVIVGNETGRASFVSICAEKVYVNPH